jgi:hypothetical protein
MAATNETAPRTKVITGRSCEPQVRLLMETLGTVLKPGDDVTHQQIAKVIGEPYPSNRYSTVVHKWIKRMRVDQRKDLESRSSVGYHVCLGDERIDSSKRDLVRAVRALKTGVLKAEIAPVEELTADGRRQRDYMLTRVATKVQMLSQDRKEIALKLVEVGKKD